MNERNAVKEREDRTVRALSDEGDEGATARQRCYLSQLRAKHMELQQIYGEKFIEAQDAELLNGNIRLRWSAIFGEAANAAQDAELRLHQLERRFTLKAEHPDWTREQVELEVAEQEAAEKRGAEQRLQHWHRDSVLALTRLNPLGYPDPEFMDFMVLYEEQRQSLAREFRKLHPDRLQQNLAYAALPEDERRKLDDLVKGRLTLKRRELGSPEGTLGWQQRSYADMCLALRQAIEILQAAGIEAPRGSDADSGPPERQIAKLETEIRCLEVDIDLAAEQVRILTTDEEIRRKKSDLSCPEQDQRTCQRRYEKFNRELWSEAKRMRREAEVVEHRLEALCKGFSVVRS